MYHWISRNTGLNTENNNSDVSATYGCLHSLMKVAVGCRTIRIVVFRVLDSVSVNGVLATQAYIMCMCISCVYDNMAPTSSLQSQRNVMLRMSLQLEMGTFSAAVCGLVGVAFGMNLDSSLEGVRA